MSPKAVIVALMQNCPVYSLAGGTLPDHSFGSGDSAPGLWAREWHNLLGAEVLKAGGEYEWETWQPDTRASREFSAVLPSGVRHRLFPAVRRLMKVGLRRQEGLHSPALLEELRSLRGRKVILMLGGTYGFHAPFPREVISSLGEDRCFPLFLRSDGMFSYPLMELPAMHRPLTYLSLPLEQLEIKSLLSRADTISEQSSEGLAAVRRVYSGHVERLGMGCDFGFWLRPSAEQKAAARARLGLGRGRTVFFASGNFQPRKQLDKLVRVAASHPRRDELFLIMAGQGTAQAVCELEKIFKPLAESGSGRMLPFVEGEALRDLYWASDVYVSVSLAEGGPVSVMKSLACGVPVMYTPVGDAAEFLDEHRAGLRLPAGDTRVWTEAIEDALSGKLPEVADRESARARYDWGVLASRYIGVFDKLHSSYFGRAV